MDEVLELLEKTTRKTQKFFEESRFLVSRQVETYETIIRSEESSEPQKVRALLGRMIEYDRLEWLSSQLSLLYILQIFAFKVKILRISIESIKEQLLKSEILEKTRDIEETKKNIEKLTILLEAQFESMKKIGEDREKSLSYVS